LPFAGGIGSGGGIHMYYFGVRGGLQEEVDARVRACLPLFGPSSQIRCFHPDAKKAVLDGMLAEAGVQTLYGAQLVAARRAGRRIAEALVATPAGARRITARGWIDATGDGDLGAAAGCRFRYGRAGDGRLHAFTQSAGVTCMDKEKPHVEVVNFDSGFTDPDDVADLTRARHLGVLQHLRAQVDVCRRPTGISPALGLRQGRHLATDAVLGLEDLITRRRFADAIALTGAHYDNHALDYDLESDQALFWTWGCGGWSERIAGEIPYGALLPSDLDDTWIACRALGVSEEAHHCVRMQRDIQRIGEVAGLAAALAQGGGSRAVDLAALQARLRDSGALPAQADDAEDHAGMGITTMSSACCRAAPAAGEPAAVLRDGSPTALWLLAHQTGESASAALRAGLADADPALSFRAAALLAWRRDRAALPRLLEAVDGAEDGLPAGEVRVDQVPRWLAALALLRLVPDAQALPALARCAEKPGVPFRGRVATAVAAEALAATGGAPPRALAALLHRLCSHCIIGAVGNPRRHPTRTTHLHFTGDWYGVAEDDTWVLFLVAARTLRRLGQPLPPAWLAFADDPRAGVRRAFAAVTDQPAKAAAAAG
ncbi:MAG: FAD-dependent oxidoreductase, partial [Planctomycetes bacterium]|nr:FAD-dependent oxidoreductase [Planctomycetota bacterium]